MISVMATKKTGCWNCTPQPTDIFEKIMSLGKKARHVDHVVTLNG